MLCFKLYFIKDATICTTAAATVRQMVSVIFERVLIEDSQGLGKILRERLVESGILKQNANTSVLARPQPCRIPTKKSEMVHKKPRRCAHQGAGACYESNRLNRTSTVK